jgi:hypothetical protein
MSRFARSIQKAPMLKLVLFYVPVEARTLSNDDRSAPVPISIGQRQSRTEMGRSREIAPSRYFKSISLKNWCFFSVDRKPPNPLLTMPTIILANHKEVLMPYRRQKERYICPACEGHNLTFSDIGEWTCWNNPTREHRFEILDRLFPDRERSNYAPKREPEYPQAIAPTIHPSQLGYPLMTDEVLCHTNGHHTAYYYSDSQRVVRVDIQPTSGISTRSAAMVTTGLKVLVLSLGKHTDSLGCCPVLARPI